MRRTVALTAGLLTLAGCSSSIGPNTVDRPTPAAAASVTATQAWLANGGQRALNDLSSSINMVDLYTRARPDDMDGACIELEGDLRGAEELPHIPDTRADANWATALRAIDQGALDCSIGARSNDASQLQGGIDDIMGAVADLATVRQLLHAT